MFFICLGRDDIKKSTWNLEKQTRKNREGKCYGR
nr:MAG TPA: hypothetical protein [Bacteriophage sp.]